MSNKRMPKKIIVPEEHWDSIFAPSSCMSIDTTVDADGRINAAPHATTTRVCHYPMYIAITVNDFSHTAANVLETGEFVVNVVPFEQRILEQVRTVGLPFKEGVNELERAGLTTTASSTVQPPRVAECKVHFECAVEWTHRWEHRVMICGRVLAVSIDEDCYDPRGRIIWDRVRPAHFCGVAYDGNFVPAYEPFYVGIPYEGPQDWRSDVEETTATSGVYWSGAGADGRPQLQQRNILAE